MTEPKRRPTRPSVETWLTGSPRVASGQEPAAIKRRTPWNTLAARVISLVSRKGGVGKTTSAVNLGAALALSGHSVLIVSIDPQCGVSRSLGYGQDELKSGLLEMFTGAQTVTDLVHTTPLKDLYFVSPNIWSLDDEESFLDMMERGVDTFITQIDRARNLFDTILIDCPPNLGPATRAALLAADSYLIPVQAEELCRDSLDRLLTFIQSFHADAYADATTDLGPHNVPDIVLEGLFLTMVNERTRMGRHVIDKVNETYSEHLFKNVIPRTVRLTEMALRGKPAVIFDRKSPGSRAYFRLADEMMARFRSRCGGESGPSVDADQNLPVFSQLIRPESHDQQHGDDHGVGSNFPHEPEVITDLENLLAELHSSDPAGDAASPESDPSDTPELVSLDEVLAEEERANDDGEWGSALWDSRRGRHNRPN